MRTLQIQNGIAVGELISTGMPVPPDPSWTFVDVTDMPTAQLGDTYDANTGTFSRPSRPAVFPTEITQLLTNQKTVLNG